MRGDAAGPSLNVVHRTLLLLDVSPFHALRSEELGALVSAMTEQRFDAGDTIFSDGDPEGRLYVIVEGAVELVQGGIALRRATRGMPFGLFGLLGIAAQDTARAVESTHVLVLTREDFVEAVNDNPAFAVACLGGLALWIQDLVARVEALESSRP
jgi:CRP-like cAMP-binding protein